MTQTAPPPSTTPETTAVESAPTTARRLIDLSMTQLLGGSLAAATAAGLGSRLGVVGTITGAAVGSVVTAVAANVYTNSMVRARDAIVAARLLGRARGAVVVPGWWRMPDAAGARRIVATAGVVFVVAAAFLAGLQLATGASVTGTSVGTRQAQAASDADMHDPSGSDGGQAPAVSPSATPAQTGSEPSAQTGTPVTSPSQSAATSAPTTPGQSAPSSTPSGTEPAETGTPTPTASAAG